MIPFKDDNPSATFPIVTVSLIIINVAVFIFQLYLGKNNGYFIYNYGVIPAEIWGFKNIAHSTEINPFLSIITSMFLHGGYLHLIGNMLYLWIFGDNIEDTFGHFSFLIFYIICGIVGASFNIIFSPGSQIPMIGASGAIAGVLGAYILRYPFAKIHTLFIIIIFFKIFKLPALFVLGFWFFIQAMNSLPSIGYTGGQVAWFAHVGGFVAGFLIMLFYPKTKKIF
ncbi:MAG: rhomboid family intramembrane serine protease [Pseudomonadota bacterium]